MNHNFFLIPINLRLLHINNVVDIREMNFFHSFIVLSGTYWHNILFWVNNIKKYKQFSHSFLLSYCNNTWKILPSIFSDEIIRYHIIIFISFIKKNSYCLHHVRLRFIIWKNQGFLFFNFKKFSQHQHQHHVLNKMPIFIIPWQPAWCRRKECDWLCSSKLERFFRFYQKFI